MTTHIALLRGINVGGHNKIPMADLRAHLATVGFEGARTLLASGNVVFQGGRVAPAELERRFEAAVRERFACSVDVVVRTAVEWQAIVARDPFPKISAANPTHYLVYCLKAAPSAARAKALQAALPGTEIVKCVGRELYTVYPAGIGDSKLTMAWIESQLGCSGTARNWNTLVKLLALTRNAD